jgi:predicted transcriptional regulator
VNFNIYVDRQTVERLNRLAKARGVTRNALIREAVEHLLARETRAGWPAAVREHRGVAGSAFESARRKLRPPRRDPLE